MIRHEYAQFLLQQGTSNFYNIYATRSLPHIELFFWARVTAYCLKMKSLLYLYTLLPLALGTHDLSGRYPFSARLYDRNGDTYVLHWNFSTADRTIAFAVNVSTTGWVGLGISPNGGMVNSDVVIGWVSNGRAYFHVSSMYVCRRVSEVMYLKEDGVVTCTRWMYDIVGRAWAVYVLNVEQLHARLSSKCDWHSLAQPTVYHTCASQEKLLIDKGLW